MLYTILCLNSGFATGKSPDATGELDVVILFIFVILMFCCLCKQKVHSAMSDVIYIFQNKLCERISACAFVFCKFSAYFNNTTIN